MPVVTRVPEPNLWDAICKEFAYREKPILQDGHVEDDAASVHTDYEDYDPAKHNPVFYGKMHEAVTTDVDVLENVDASTTHPACVGFTFVEKPPKSPPPPRPRPPPVHECSPREYLEHYIFPILLPALEEMLKQAKEEKCFERKRTKFNALDFLTEHLYRRNPNFTDRSNVLMEDIPFVKEWLKDHPRPPLPLSLVWTEEEATVIIQSQWRGYLVRRDPEIQELREWQRQYREDNRGIQRRVSDFWEKQMPGGGVPPADVAEDKSKLDDRPAEVRSETGTPTKTAES